MMNQNRNTAHTFSGVSACLATNTLGKMTFRKVLEEFEGGPVLPALELPVTAASGSYCFFGPHLESVVVQ